MAADGAPYSHPHPSPGLTIERIAARLHLRHMREAVTRSRASRSSARDVADVVHEQHRTCRRGSMLCGDSNSSIAPMPPWPPPASASRSPSLRPKTPSLGTARPRTAAARTVSNSHRRASPVDTRRRHLLRRARRSRAGDRGYPPAGRCASGTSSIGVRSLAAAPGLRNAHARHDREAGAIDQHFRRPRPRIVVGCHRVPVRARRADASRSPA